MKRVRHPAVLAMPWTFVRPRRIGLPSHVGCSYEFYNEPSKSLPPRYEPLSHELIEGLKISLDQL